MQIPQGKKIYFASDFHLGAPNEEASLLREKKIIKWLESIEHDAFEIYLLGDVFDFWFEYKKVIPRGFVRLQGKLAALTDSGIKIHWFHGNHDMWVFDYIPKELGVTLHQAEIEKNYNGKTFLIGHGDGLGPGDHGYKFIKKVFRSNISQWLFARLHPNFGIGMANFFSSKSRKSTGTADDVFYGEEKEMLIQYCLKKLESKQYDYFIFGHRHLPINFDLPNGAKYMNSGDWIKHDSFLVFDGDQVILSYFK